MSRENKKTAWIPADEEMMETVNEKTLMDQLDTMKTSLRGYDKEATDMIETPDQARTLASWGCDYLQGYLIAPPLSYGDLLTFLKENGKKNFLEG